MKNTLKFFQRYHQRGAENIIAKLRVRSCAHCREKGSYTYEAKNKKAEILSGVKFCCECNSFYVMFTVDACEAEIISFKEAVELAKSELGEVEC